MRELRSALGVAVIGDGVALTHSIDRVPTVAAPARYLLSGRRARRNGSGHHRTVIGAFTSSSADAIDVGAERAYYVLGVDVLAICHDLVHRPGKPAS